MRSNGKARSINDGEHHSSIFGLSGLGLDGTVNGNQMTTSKSINFSFDGRFCDLGLFKPLLL
jgi:hypothetical protein